MKHRKLRIAWSVAWGVVAVLLVALWVRSYPVRDSFQFNIASRLHVYALSVHGRLLLFTLPFGWQNQGQHSGITEEVLGIDIPGAMDCSPAWSFASGAVCRAAIKYPMMLLFVMVCGMLPNVRFTPRFSLSALLVATALFAVGLTLVIAAR